MLKEGDLVVESGYDYGRGCGVVVCIDAHAMSQLQYTVKVLWMGGDASECEWRPKLLCAPHVDNSKKIKESCHKQKSEKALYKELEIEENIMTHQRKKKMPMKVGDLIQTTGFGPGGSVGEVGVVIEPYSRIRFCWVVVINNMVRVYAEDGLELINESR